MLGEAIKGGWFNKPGKTPLESVWYEDFENILFELNIILANEH